MECERANQGSRIERQMAQHPPHPRARQSPAAESELIHITAMQQTLLWTTTLHPCNLQAAARDTHMDIENQAGGRAAIALSLRLTEASAKTAWVGSLTEAGGDPWHKTNSL